MCLFKSFVTVSNLVELLGDQIKRSSDIEYFDQLVDISSEVGLCHNTFRLFLSSSHPVGAAVTVLTQPSLELYHIHTVLTDITDR